MTAAALSAGILASIVPPTDTASSSSSSTTPANDTSLLHQTLLFETSHVLQVLEIESTTKAPVVKWSSASEIKKRRNRYPRTSSSSSQNKKQDDGPIILPQYPYALTVTDGTHSIRLLLYDDASSRRMVQSKAVIRYSIVEVQLGRCQSWPFVAIAQLAVRHRISAHEKPINLQRIEEHDATALLSQSRTHEQPISAHEKPINIQRIIEEHDATAISKSHTHEQRNSAHEKPIDVKPLEPAAALRRSNENNTHVNSKAISKLDSTSVLSENYVLNKFKHINEVRATTLYAKGHVAADAPLQKNDVVPFTPATFVSMPDSELCPVRGAATDEHYLYYAIQQRIDKLRGGPKSATTANVTNTSSKESQLPLVDSIAHLHEYCHTFEELLTAERQELALLYERYSQYDHPMMVQSKSVANSNSIYTCTIHIPGIADASPPLQVGDIMLVRTMIPVGLPLVPAVGRSAGTYPPNIIEIRCTVQSIQRQGDFVHGTWLDWMTHNLFISALPSGMVRYNLRFVPRATKHFRCLSALDWMGRQSPSQSIMSLLFPITAPIMPNDSDAVSDIDKKMVPIMDELNLQQRDFVKLAMRRSRHVEYNAVRGPLTLTGPAGTGKTNTMLAAVLQILATDSGQSSIHVLICTPSHTACDNIIVRLGKFLKRDELFRLYDSARPIETVPVQVLGYARQAMTGEFCLPSTKELLSFRVIVSTCEDAHLLYQAGVTNQQLRVRRRDFSNYLQQACSSYNMTATLTGIDQSHFTHLFIDEAAQATEPESLIPLSVVFDVEPGCRKVEIVLVGDPRQLSPSVYSTRSMAAGLGRSWMERLLLRPISALGGGRSHMLGPEMIDLLDYVEVSFRENLSVFLTANYRGHPSFLMVPSSLFYFDKLHSAVPIHGGLNWYKNLRWIESLSEPVLAHQSQSTTTPSELHVKKQFDWPIHLRGVKGKDCSVTIQSGFAANSWQNHEEAEAIVAMAVELVAKDVSTEAIGVMAPFRAQVVLIRDLLRRQGLGGINVGLVEDYQAVERDVILLSLTRSTWDFVESDKHRRIGLFGQPKRSNVALTRARNLFVVVGDPRAMARDFYWRQFLLFCHRNCLFYGYSGEAEGLYEWSDEKRVASTRLELHPLSNGITLASNSSTSSKEVDDDPDLILVSSLERSNRGASS